MIIFTTIVAVLFVAKGVRFVREDQRMIVERLGRFHAMRGPGWHASIPFLDRHIIVYPEQMLPGWRGYTEEQLEKKLVREFYDRGAPGLGTVSIPTAEDATSDQRERQAALQMARQAAEEAAERQRRLTQGGTDGP